MNSGSRFPGNFILASALFHAPPRDRAYANCANVLRHALIAAGLWDTRFSDAFHGDDETLARFPEVMRWYSTLVELTRHEPESERLLNGFGNLAAPAGAYFTGCRLTPAGEVLAKQLLAENPDWKVHLTTPDK